MKTRQDGKFSMLKIICYPSCDSRRGPWIVLSREHQSRTPDLLERVLHDRISLNERRVGVGISLQIVRQQFSADRLRPQKGCGLGDIEEYCHLLMEKFADILELWDLRI